MTKNIHANLWKLYTIKALTWFILIMPILVPFLQENGLSMKEIFLLQSIYSVAILIFEIPSGYFADVVDRKSCIIIGCVLGFLGHLVYPFSHDFLGFLIAELILGLSSSFLSGADSAILYDSLAEIGESSDYKKAESRMLSIGNFSEATASLIGGFLAVISLRTPFYLEIILMFMSIPFALSLIEPKRKRHENTQGSLREISKILHYAMHQNGEIKWLILYSGFIGASNLMIVWFIQPYFDWVNLPLAYFGVIWALLNLSVGVFSLCAHGFESKLGRKKSLISLVVLSFIGYLSLASFNSLWAILFIFIFYFVRGINGPVLRDYLNQVIPSEMRATILSIKNLAARLIFAILGPLFGWISDIYSLPTALLYCGFIFMICGCTSLLFLSRNKALIKI